MVSKLFLGAILALPGISVSAIACPERPHGFCKQLNLRIPVTADTAVFDIPRVDNDIEAVAWAIHDATRTTDHGPGSIIKNTTLSTTFNIHAQLCVPKSTNNGKHNILQIATHGVHYDSRYWDSTYKPEDHSYVEAALKAGYSILTYDRLGVGQSDKPDAYNVVQAPVELEILRQLTLMARNGSLYEFAGHAQPSEPAFKALAVPHKVVHIGHSYGSFLTSSFIARYGPLSDGAVITGYLVTENLGSAGSTSFCVEYAATGSPPFDRPSGYVVSQRDGIQNIFFGGNPKTAFTPELLDYGISIKQPVAIGTFAAAYSLVGNPGPSFRAPVQFLLPEFDFYVCRGDCRGLADIAALNATYPHATKIEVALQPNTGHALPLHNNATAGFQLMFDFFSRNGL